MSRSFHSDGLAAFKPTVWSKQEVEALSKHGPVKLAGNARVRQIGPIAFTWQARVPFSGIVLIRISEMPPGVRRTLITAAARVVYDRVTTDTWRQTPRVWVVTR